MLNDYNPDPNLVMPNLLMLLQLHLASPNHSVLGGTLWPMLVAGKAFFTTVEVFLTSPPFTLMKIA